MREVWVVRGMSGEWSDYTDWVDSVWETEADAVSHVVRELGAEYAGACLGRYRWTRRGRSWLDEDGEEFVDDDADYSIERYPVRHMG